MTESKHLPPRRDRVRFYNSWEDDVFLLAKGHYGHFTESNMAVRYARLIRLQYGFKDTTTVSMATIMRCLFTALTTQVPTYFDGNPHLYMQLLEDSVKNPEEGLRTLNGYIALTKTKEHDPRVVKDLPVPCKNMKRFVNDLTLSVTG